MERMIYDCLYGQKKVTDVEYRMILSPELQRLRYIRLSNINSLLNTGGSEINRFEHSLGVFLLMKEWIRQNDEFLYESEKVCLKAAALFHDIQSTPFGHSLQYIFEDNKSINENISFEHQDLIESTNNNLFQENNYLKSFCGFEFKIRHLYNQDDLSTIFHLIDGKGKFGELISSDIDFDNIDNVIRLAYHMGILDFDDHNLPFKIISEIKMTENGLVWNKDVIPYIEKWQKIRKSLYNILLLDWADFSAKAMLTHALEIAVDKGYLNINNWRETDSDLLELLKNIEGEGQNCNRIIKRLIVGDLYFPFLLLTTSSIETYEVVSLIECKKCIENDIKKILGGVSCIFHPILDNRKTERSVSISIGDDSIKTKIGSDSQQLLIGVFLINEYKKKNKNSVKQQIIEYLSTKDLLNLKIIYTESELF